MHECARMCTCTFRAHIVYIRAHIVHISCTYSAHIVHILCICTCTFVHMHAVCARAYYARAHNVHGMCTKCARNVHEMCTDNSSIFCNKKILSGGGHSHPEIFMGGGHYIPFYRGAGSYSTLPVFRSSFLLF